MLVQDLRTTLKDRRGSDVAVIDNDGSHTVADLRADVRQLTQAIVDECPVPSQAVFGVAMKSSYAWIIAMLATHFSRATLLPVPIEFSDTQIASLLGKANLIFGRGDHIRDRLNRAFPDKPVVDPLDFGPDWGVTSSQHIDEGASQGMSIIHTSGTTSIPKGVIISESGIDALLKSLWPRIPSGPLDYSSVVPMSLLIEQVTGAYIPLLTGGCIRFLTSDLPEFGAESANLDSYLSYLETGRPRFAYLPPALISALDDSDEAEYPELKQAHIITGGASLQVNTLESLATKGFSIFEAYGMSENSSMISLNYPGHNKIGTAGPILPHVEGRIMDGELEIRSESLCLGYFNAAGEGVQTEGGWFKTGDLCEIDADGFLKVVGRRKHLIILSSARNVSAEWVENTYKEHDAINDIVVMGEGKSHLGAVVLSDQSPEHIADALETRNDRLANYARVSSFLVAPDPTSFRKDYFTVTGRPRRKKIFADYAPLLWEE